MKTRCLLWTCLLAIGHISISNIAARDGSPDPNPTRAEPARPRTITVKGFSSYEPLFAREAKTLNPKGIVRTAWKSYLSNMCEPWGMTSGSPLGLPGLQPMLRCCHDNRALPWPRVKPHPVDAMDTNARSLGAHALLHAMLGGEKDKDPIEAGQIAYVLGQAPGGADSFIVTGELAKNILLLHKHSGTEWLRDWAGKVIPELRPPVDDPDPMGGWMHLQVGWNLCALSDWYELTGDRASLELAVACADRICNTRDAHGNDGAFRRDGSFGGESQQTTASWHMHGHTHCLPGLLSLGETLLKDGQKEKGLQTISQARRSFDWLYDPIRNPDAGSMTGWLGEWLIVATGWDRKSDCEGCTMGDVVQIAAELGAVSRLDPSLAGQVDYYDRAEQIFRGQVVESIFRPRPEYLAVLRDCLEKRVETGALGEVSWQDQSTRKNHATLRRGDVQRVVGEFSDEEVPAIRFDGRDHFELRDSAALRVPQFSVHAVVKVTEAGTPEETYFSNYDNPINWGKGINLAILPSRKVLFFTTDGTEKNYDRMTSTSAVPEGFHIITTTYGSGTKNIYVDGVNVGSQPSKGLDYGDGTVASVGSMREFHSWLDGDIAEILIYETVGVAQQTATENYLSGKYGIPVPSRSDSEGGLGAPILWLKADVGYVRERPEPTPQDRKQEVERLYQEALQTARRLEGRLLGLCGFPDWANRFPSHDQDPELPAIDMMGCCADAVIRASHAIWAETVTGDVEEARVNLAFNRASPLLDVVSCLPHRGEVNVIVKTARKVLVRVPRWAPKQDVKAYVQRKPEEVIWSGEYVVFDKVKNSQQLTVTYPLRIAEVKETPGSLDGTEYTEKWRGNTIVDISPPGKLIPMFQRPELDTERVP